MAKTCRKYVTGGGRRGMSGDAMTVLALNAGSSSLKFGVFNVSETGSETLLSGEEESVGNPQAAMARIAAALTAKALRRPVVVGHRIVHGGPTLRRHARIDATVRQQLESAKAFAPLHVPEALALLDAAQKTFPDTPQVACLDTAFHAGMPDIARTLPLPGELRALGVERYGFHGISYESIVRRLGNDIPKRLIIAHLGHGASVTAVENGLSIDTSMGLTPTGGVIMSTRCGDLDPGVLAYVVREHGYTALQLEALIDERSGMLGISGVSGDVRVLHADAVSESLTSADSRLAIAMFCYSVRKQIAAMMVALGGLDLLVFTGGIGEHDAVVRATISDGLTALGVRDVAAVVRVMPAQEEQQIAWQSWNAVRRSAER